MKVATTFLLYFLICPTYGHQNQLIFEKNSAISCKGNFNVKPMYNDRNKEVALLYLKRYEHKDLQGIAEMFSNEIILRDWKIRVEGKQNALHETKKNFDSVDSLNIEVLDIYDNENTVAAELKIILNNKEELYVVDLITVNSEGKIISIKAFIGRGN